MRALPLGKDAWTKEFVNGTQTHTIKDLKAGMSYRVRVVAKDHLDQTLHTTDELVIMVPGEVACAGCANFLVPPSPLRAIDVRLHPIPYYSLCGSIASGVRKGGIIWGKFYIQKCGRVNEVIAQSQLLLPVILSPEPSKS